MFRSDGRLLFEQIVRLDLEGIVCKRKDSPYKVTSSLRAMDQSEEACVFLTSSSAWCNIRPNFSTAIQGRDLESRGFLGEGLSYVCGVADRAISLYFGIDPH